MYLQEPERYTGQNFLEIFDGVTTAEAAWQIVDWYKMRWTIEQFWRLLKLGE